LVEVLSGYDMTYELYFTGSF